MLEKLRFGKEKSLDVKVRIPKHIAITMDGIEKWRERNTKADAYKESFSRVMDIIKYQVKLDIPLLTFYVMKEKKEKSDEFFEELSKFINFLLDEEFIKEKGIKVSVLGKWYDLPSKIVEPIKKLIDMTKENEDYFVNLCVNYDGQEEIVDACKLIARKVMAEKIDPDSIDKSTIKESAYSSYFIPPELIIVNGKKNMKTSLLLWDSANSSIYFSNVFWPDFSKSDLMDGINAYQKSQ